MRLIEPSIEYERQILAYRSEFLAAGSSMDGCGSLRRFEDIAAWLETLEAMKRPETVPEGLVPSTLYIYVREEDGKVLGMLQLRHCLNETLEKYAGHIGYSVAPSERRKGFAKAMLHDALGICRDIGLKRVLVSCRPENEGSRRTILANGGVYDGTVWWPERDYWLERYWIAVPE